MIPNIQHCRINDIFFRRFLAALIFIRTDFPHLNKFIIFDLKFQILVSGYETIQHIGS